MKRILVFVLCMAMLLGLSIHSGAEEDRNILFDCSVVEGDSLFCFGEALPEGGKVTVTAGSGEAAFELTTPEQANLPITYFCMVDQSSALSIVQRNHQKEALLLISDNMRANDKMVLVLMHETLSFSQPMMDREERYQAIQDACVYDCRYTTLYSYVTTVLETMADSEAYPGLRCVVLFSDGINDKNTDVSEDNAREAIRHYQFPLHTISIINTFPDGYALKNVARMDSFSEESVGGVHTVPVRDGVSAEEAVTKLMEAMLGSTAIRLDTVSLDRSRDQLGIQVSWQSGEESRVGTVSVNTGSLPAPATEPTEPETTEPATTEPETTEETTEATEAPTETEVTQTESEPEPETTEAAPTETTLDEAARYQKESKRSRDTMIVGAVVLLVIIAIVLLLLRRKSGDSDDGDANQAEPQKTDSQEQEPEDMPEIKLEFSPAAPAEAEPEAVSIPEAENPEQLPPVVLPVLPETEEAPAEAPAPIQEPEAEPEIQPVFEVPEEVAEETDLGKILEGLTLGVVPGADVRLEPMEKEDAITEFFLPINTAMSLGRTERADVVLNKDDRGLSGVHFELQWDGRTLFLRDAKSTNGTGVNGVPMRPGNWTRVNNGAIIRAGAFRYKVYAFKAK